MSFPDPLDMPSFLALGEDPAARHLFGYNDEDGKYLVAVYAMPDGTHYLTWTDGINDWTESAPSLATALLRLGVLAYAARRDIPFFREFQGSPQYVNYEVRAGHFLASSVSE